MKRMSAIERVFVDTNVWLYAFVDVDPVKSAQAKRILQQEAICISVQIVNEVCANLIRKANYKESDVRALIESFYAKYLVAPLDQRLLIQASQLRERYSLSFWDSTIVAAAIQSQARVLYSEDLQDGLLVDGVLQIANPFRS